MSASLNLLHTSKQQFITNPYQCDACDRSFPDTRSFINTNVSGNKSKTIVQCLPAIRFLFLYFTCFIVENVFSHVCISKTYF